LVEHEQLNPRFWRRLTENNINTVRGIFEGHVSSKLRHKAYIEERQRRLLIDPTPENAQAIVRILEKYYNNYPNQRNKRQNDNTLKVVEQRWRKNNPSEEPGHIMNTIGDKRPNFLINISTITNLKPQLENMKLNDIRKLALTPEQMVKEIGKLRKTLEKRNSQIKKLGKVYNPELANKIQTILEKMK
jgi:hypothetical protein